MRKSLVWLMGLLISFSSFSQDPVFTQFLANTLYHNPGNAGNAETNRLFAQYRNQLPAIKNAYVTYDLSIDMPVKPLHGGFGVNILHDRQAGGYMTNTLIDMIYAYRWRTSKKMQMSLGFSTSFSFYRLNTANLTVGEYETLEPKSITQPDFSLGYTLSTRSFQTGLAINHLNSGLLLFNYNFIEMPFKLTYFAFKHITLTNERKVKNNEIILTPAILAQLQGSTIDLVYGAALSKSSMDGGAYMRNISSILFVVGYSFNTMRVGYSYDFNIRSVGMAVPYTFAHEITLTTLLYPDPKRNLYGPVKCPKIYMPE